MSGRRREPQDMDGCTLAQLMTPRVHFLPATAALQDAVVLMQTEHCASVLIGCADQLEGVISEHDVMEAVRQRRSESTPIGELMTSELVRVSWKTSCQEAFDCMQRQGASLLLVEGRYGQPLGMVSEAEFRQRYGLAMVARLRHVHSLMTRDVLVVEAGASLRRALDLMHDSHHDVLVVLNEAQQPAGILTERDSLRLFGRPELLDQPVSAVVSQQVHTLPERAWLSDAAMMMLEHRIRHLPVVDAQGRLAGMLSEHELLSPMQAHFVDGLMRDKQRLHRRLVREQDRHQQDEQRQDKIMDAALDAMIIIDAHGRVKHINRSARGLLGLPGQSHAGVGQVMDLVAECDRTRLSDALARLYAGECWLDEWLFKHRDQHLVSVELSAQPLGQQEFLLVGRDLTERKRQEAQLRLAANVFEHAFEAILITDANQRILDVNRRFTEITGYTKGEVLGQTPRLLKSGVHDESYYRNLWFQLNTQGHWQGEVTDRDKQGNTYSGLLTISAVHDADDKVRHYVGLYTDISELKAIQHQLEGMAHYDVLTGLPNRRLLLEMLQRAVHQALDQQQMLAVCFVDLDGFKAVNDQLGHAAGDDLLIQASLRMQEALRPGDVVARLGGDEFVLLCAGLHQAKDIEPILLRLLERLRTPFELDEASVQVSASVGVTFCPDDCGLPELLIDHADKALYVAKQLGRDRWHIYLSRQGH